MARGGVGVGLDVGTSVVKVAEVAVAKHGVELVTVGWAECPPGAIREGYVTDPARVSAAIRRAVGSAQVRGKEVACAVASQDVVVRHVRIPRVEPAELAQAVRWEAQACIPYPVDEAVLDFEVSSEAAGLGPNEMELTIVAAPRSLVDSHLNAIREAGLRPTVLDVQPFTLARSLGRKPAESRDQAQAFVDVGAGTTDIAIFFRGSLVFTRIVQIGGNDFTMAVASGMGVEFEEAERLKRSIRDGAPGVPGREAAGGQWVFGSEEMDRWLVPVAERLASEVSRSLDFFASQPQGKVCAESGIDVVATGGGTMLSGLLPFLSRQTGFQIRRGELFKRVTVSSPRLAQTLVGMEPTLSVAVGLALRGVERGE